MDEDQKDQIEDISSAVVEAAISSIPIVGGPAAVLTNRILGSAVQRRQARILVELRDDLTRLQQSGLVAFDQDLAESEPFQAALQRSVRQLLESDSDDKRALLRNALLNRIVGVDDPDRFADALERVHPRDVVMLQLVGQPASDAKVAQMQALIKNEGEARVIERKRRLIGLNLIIDTAGTDPDDDASRMLGNVDGKTRGNDLRPYWSMTTELGRDFLTYVHNPIAGAEPAASGGTAPR
ncbi:hypothetical protein ITJ58_01235 [Curtobacterium flaccumfaciens]|uniref:hypothetical protein n=1 Tax=Curtobacterium flaccumfaciens TaxID=2035 RepID=UPI00188BF419|nr:hypothetical protein [Curtobacterium flaccumfaciens]MBF4592371.1 hypothetical protein [Curtobacterium flaccumfaciens]